MRDEDSRGTDMRNTPLLDVARTHSQATTDCESGARGETAGTTATAGSCEPHETTVRPRPRYFAIEAECHICV